MVFHSADFKVNEFLNYNIMDYFLHKIGLTSDNFWAVMCHIQVLLMALMYFYFSSQISDLEYQSPDLIHENHVLILKNQILKQKEIEFDWQCGTTVCIWFVACLKQLI